MLLIGDRDQKPGRDRVNDPVVYPEATLFLVNLLNAKAAGDGKPLPDSLRVGALVGLQRHAKFGVHERNLEPMTATLLALVEQSKPPEGRSAAGHDWMRRMAAEALGDLKRPGDEGAVAKALAAIVSQSDARLSLRCAAAEALGKIDLSAVDIPGTATAGALAGLAVAACDYELPSVGMGSHVRLAERIAGIGRGAGNLAKLPSPPEGDLSNLAPELKQAYDKLLDRNMSDDKLPSLLPSIRGPLAKLAGKVAPPPQPVVEPATPDPAKPEPAEPEDPGAGF